MADIDLSALKPTKQQASRYIRQIMKSLASAPGIQAATLISLAPISGNWSAGHYFSVVNHGSIHDDMQTWLEEVSPGYFQVMGTRILEGRGFRPADEHAEHVCVLSASAAAYFFPMGNALGRFVYSGGNDPSKDQENLDPKNACRVIGIAENARFRSLREAPPRMLYTVTGDWSAPFAFMAVRSSSTSVAAGAIRAAVRRVTPGVPDPKIFTFNELVRQQLRSERMLMSLSACFAGIALLLTAIGLYGLLARIITLRTKEIGLRLALGAQPHHALASVMRQTLRLMLVGIGIGLLAALGVTHLLRTLLFGVQVDNPWMLSAAVAVLILITLLASYMPARRAARVDPMVALREE